MLSRRHLQRFILIWENKRRIPRTLAGGAKSFSYHFKNSLRANTNTTKNFNLNVLAHTCKIQVLGRLRKENFEFEASLDYIVRACLKRKK
jgi:hypothetical protein